MGYFVKVGSETTRKYEMVGESSFKGLLFYLKEMQFHKTTYDGKDIAVETYFDTPENLLAKSGIVLSKFDEENNHFIKVENTAFLSKILNKLKKEVFVHKIGANDTLSDHAFYIKDGITALYTTSFSIDLENVIKNAIAYIKVTTRAKIYSVASGTGMRVKVALEDKKIENFGTKRNHVYNSITVKLANNNKEVFMEEFKKFNELLQKNCKEFIETSENQFEFITKVTKPIEPKIVEKKPEKKKSKVQK